MATASPEASASPLVGVFLCEFDNLVGRILAFQEPHDCLAAEEFDAICEYLIPKPALCGQLIVLRTATKTVLCYPECIEHEKYARNALLFSLSFVLTPQADVPDADPDARAVAETEYTLLAQRWGRVLGEAARSLTTLERETELLSSADRKGELRHLLPLILHDLRASGSCSVPVDAAHSIRLKLEPPPPPPAPPVRAHQVAVLVAEVPAAESAGWDLAVQTLLPLIDGTVAPAALRALPPLPTSTLPP